MTTSVSTKLRVIGSASVIALSFGMGSYAFAQAAPAPSPTPTPAPMGCNQDGNVVICSPALDADGFTSADDGITLTVEENARVEGEINLADDSNVTVGGEVVVATGDSALDLGNNATVVNNGALEANPFGDGIISVEDNGSVTNNGTITSSGSPLVGGIVVETGSTVVNAGTIDLEGNVNLVGIVGGLTLEESNISVTNTADGVISIDTGAFGNGIGILLDDDVTIINEGLIETAGDFTFPIVVGNNATVTNSGMIISTGDASSGITAEDNAVITNSGTISTAGATALGVFVRDNSTIDNSGTITTSGTDSIAVFARNGTVFTNTATGMVTTTGERAQGVFAVNGVTINNAGTIETEGDDAFAIEAIDDLTITNSGTIQSAGDRAIDAGDGLTITNQVGGLITTTSDEDTIQSGDNTTIVNNGTISNSGFDTKIIDAGDNLTVTNNGTITSDWKGIEGEANFTLTNNAGATIFSTNDEAVEADDAGLVVVNNGDIIAPKDDAVDGGADVTITNTGLIQGGENDGLELDSGTITNSGIIESLSSDPSGDFSDIGLTNRELDAGIDFDGVDDPANLAGPATDTVTNLAGGIIRGDIGINASSGNFVDDGMGNGVASSPANVRSQTIVNFGTITGNAVNPATGRTDAVLLSFGDDTFQQWQTGVTNGTVDGEDGFDTLIFGNDAATLLTRSLTNINDDTQYTGFETIALLDIGGGIALTGEGEAVLTLLGGDITIDGAQTGTVIADGEGSLTVSGTGSVAVDGDDAVVVNVDGFAITNAGSITSDGERAIEAEDGLTLINSGTIEATDRAINAGDDVTITNEMGGLINTTGDADTIQTGDNTTIVNNGTISNEGFDTKIIDAGDNLTVTNNGTITSDWKGVEGEANFTLTNNAGALIFSTNDEAVEADDAGLVVVNDGDIIAPKDDAVDGGADVTITNTGLIQGGENDGLELDSGVITNSGIIESLSSDPDGDFSDAGLTNRELDAGIDFDGVDDPANLAGPATDTVTNLAGGIIRGDIGINASSGNFVDDGEGGSVAGSPANVRSQTIVNFGEITANLVNPVTGRLDAVLLGAGADEFQQWTGATVNGWVDLEGGDDTFILEGTSSSVTGSVSGGAGNDTAILAGTLDSDNLVDFETIQLGSQLGGTLNDLDISGNRTVSGDVVHVGIVNVNLGVDSLTTDGSITLEETGVLNILTPLDEELLGETVLVLQDGTGFTNNGATVNIIDDDLLLEYTPVIGSFQVQVNSVNALADNADPNLAGFGAAVAAGLDAGTLDTATFDTLNALDAASYSQALSDALPTLNEGVGREIFESGSLATQALDRHIAGEGTGIWGQIAVRTAEQDALSSSVDGYESDQLVFTIGGDVALGDNVRVGLMASYADIEVDDETAAGVETNESEIDSIRLGAYVAADIFERGFINAELSYLTGEVDTARNGLLGSVSSSYDFDGVAGRVVIGYDVLEDKQVSLTPTIGLNGASISFDDALESGGFGFLVQREDADFLEARIGAQLASDFSDKFSGFIQGIYAHDLEDDARLVTLSSTQLPTFGAVIPGREQDRFELSAGATFKVSDTFVIEAGYLGDFADGYDAHSGRASVRIAF